MLTRLRNGQIYDPAQNLEGTIGDLWFEGGTILDASHIDREADYEYDLGGHLVMAGGIDPHTHIGGGKVNLARMLLPEMMRGALREGAARHGRRQVLLEPRRDSFLPPAPQVGRRYLEMGYTACFEPAMIPTGARMTHAELADTPGLDTGAYVILGNDDILLRMIQDQVPQAWINTYVGWLVSATRALGVKVVNAGGISAFKYNARHLDVDHPHPRYGVTPADVIRVLTRAVDELGIPQPLHVHASNLGMAGNVESTLKTIAAADGHRIHLTHVQFHSYGSEGPQRFSSGAERIARAVLASPQVTVDVGQIMFGQTVTISADSMHQFHSSRFAKPRKSVILDIECEAGCGVVPFRYENRRFVNALQWGIGLELFLMIDDPSRVFLTTDHPNGGPFTSYPHLIRLLMDRSFRETALAEIDPDAAAATSLRGLARQYTLGEVAMMTRLGPARFLGLERLGHLSPGAVADIAVYRQTTSWEDTFAKPAYVFRRGRLVVRDGQWIDGGDKVSHSLSVPYDASLLEKVRRQYEAYGAVPWRTIAIGEEEMAASIGAPLEQHRCPERGDL